MNAPEREWKISQKVWDKMSWEERAALEVEQQGTKYAALRISHEETLQYGKARDIIRRRGAVG